VNFFAAEADQRVHFHGRPKGLIEVQTEAIGTPLVRSATPEDGLWRLLQADFVGGRGM